MIAKLQCWIFGHKRMRRVKDKSIEVPGFQHYECPRCGMRQVRKAKAA